MEDNDSFDFNMELNLNDFEIDLDQESKTDARILKPKMMIRKKNFVKYSHAEEMAKELEITKRSSHYAIVSGSFIFGDLIEALILKYNWKVKELFISTLSLSQENIDSLAGLLDHGYVEKLTLLVSAYYYSHEKWSLVPYMYKTLDKENRFQLAVYRTHCKITQIDTGDLKLVLHGSANMRSSGNIEQVMIEENEELYNFNKMYHNEIIEKYKTIKG